MNWNTHFTLFLIGIVLGFCSVIAAWAVWGIIGLYTAKPIAKEAAEDAAAIQGATGVYEEPDHVRLLREGYVTRQEVKRKQALLFAASKKERDEAIAARNWVSK